MTRRPKPKHRRCTRPRHHEWTYRTTLGGWTIARCSLCGLEDLA